MIAIPPSRCQPVGRSPRIAAAMPVAISGVMQVYSAAREAPIRCTARVHRM